MKFAYLIEPPFNYKDEHGLITGCDVELAKTVLKTVGVTDLELVEAEFAALLPGLNNSSWQMTTGLFATEQRQHIAAFSRPIWALADGLLVQQGNPKKLTGYRSIAQLDDALLAVIKDQFQHQTAMEFGIPDTRIKLYKTYEAAAKAVLDGSVDAYASVGRAHSGYLDQHKDLALEVVDVPTLEKPPAFGCFGFHKQDDELREAINQALAAYLGSTQHRAIMATFGFSDEDVDLVVN
ncbi:MAG: transporter substrate-binding domain-containing protein [Deinococcota bacterium]